MKRPPGWTEPAASQEAFWGMMNKDTKEPTEKVLLCRKPATPAVTSFGKIKLNNMVIVREEQRWGWDPGVENSEDRKRNREGED